MQLACPRCRVALEPASEATPGGRIELDYCPSCRGVWFDAHELAALLRLGRSDVFATNSRLLGDGVISVDCPRHPGIRMYERRVAAGAAGETTSSPLAVDQCPRCEGLWLDGGELERVATALRAAGAAEVVENPTKASTLTWLFLALTGLPVEEWGPPDRGDRSPCSRSCSPARGGAGIAWWAHIGGFVVGGLTALALQARPGPVLAAA